jgi:tRNA (guanosine-2'-O-)-methyltransferase
MFPFSEALQVSPHTDPNFRVSYQDVHRHVGPLLTPERKFKIDGVARERCFSNCVVLENIYDRGNISAVMRSAEALGFAQTHLIELGEKFKESQRTTAGADKWLEVKKWKSTKACIETLKASGHQIVVTHLDSTSKLISEIDFSEPTALVLGNEKDGVSPEMVAAADHRVLLPMTGFVQSYNISVAGALAFYHIFMDRVRRLGRNGSLSQKEIEILQAEYYLRSLDSAEDVLRELKGRKVIL